MVAMTKAPTHWSDVRLAEVTSRQASAPTAFGTQASAWRCASLSFMEAHRHQLAGETERAVELRKSAFATLHAAGLRVEQAMTGQHLDDAQGDRAATTPAHTRVTMVAECTARMLWLRDQADGAPPHFAERAGAQYAAAACYERAVREWNRTQMEAAGTWMRAAEQMLSAHVVPAPWHKQLDRQPSDA
mgnify:CR=1 FL=1